MALAMRSERGRRGLEWFSNPVATVSLVAAVLSLCAPWAGVHKPAVVMWIVAPMLVGIAAASVIGSAVLHPDRSGVLDAPPLRLLGRVSYGLYIFHYFVPQALNFHVPLVAGLTEGPEKVMRVAIWTVLSIMLAAASWRH